MKNKLKISGLMLLVILFLTGGIIPCKGTGVIISSNGKHEALDCASSTIPMQVDNPNPNYDYHWHYVLFDTSFGGCSYDNWSNLIGYGSTISVPANMGNFFAIVCYADSAGMLWDDSHWFKVRRTSLNAPVCLPSFQNGPCGERYASIPQVFYLDSNNTFVNFQWLKNGLPFIPSGPNAPFDVELSTSGYYCLRVQVGNCGYAYSDSIQVVVNKPTPVITPSGATSFCSGGNVMLQVNAGIGATYQWKKNGINIPGATSSSYYATVSGNYKVVKTNSYGCTGTSAATAVTVYGNPSASIIPQGPTTFCAGDSVQLKTALNSGWTYQWKRNNNSITGATSNKYFSKTAGFYKVKVTNSQGCTAISSPVQVSVPCRSEEESPGSLPPELMVYPNPAKDHLTIICKGILGNSEIIISDVRGRQVYSGSCTSGNQVPVDNLEAGLYCLKLTSNKFSRHTAFVISR